MNDREQRIRERAHELWLEDGQPEGLALHHWLQAEGEIDQASASKDMAWTANRRARARKKSATAFQGAKPGSSEASQSAEELAQDMGQSPGVAIPDEQGDRDARVRRRAEELWERAGRQGALDDFLEDATSQIDAEFEEGATLPSPADQRKPILP